MITHMSLPIPGRVDLPAFATAMAAAGFWEERLADTIRMSIETPTDPKLGSEPLKEFSFPAQYADNTLMPTIAALLGLPAPWVAFWVRFASAEAGIVNLPAIKFRVNGTRSFGMTQAFYGTLKAYAKTMSNTQQLGEYGKACLKAFESEWPSLWSIPEVHRLAMHIGAQHAHDQSSPFGGLDAVFLHWGEGYVGHLRRLHVLEMDRNMLGIDLNEALETRTLLACRFVRQILAVTIRVRDCGKEFGLPKYFQHEIDRYASLRDSLNSTLKKGATLETAFPLAQQVARDLGIVRVPKLPVYQIR